MKLRTKLIAILTICMSVCLVFGLTGCGGSKVKLSAPTNLTYDGEVFRWDAVKDAESYIIKINDSDTEIPVGTNQFGYNAAGQTIKITVKGDCKTKEVKSVEEASMTFTYLGKIDDASITISDTGEVSWPAFSGATAYEVKDDLTQVATTIYATSYQLPVGKTKFRVRPTVAGNSSVYSYFTTSRELTKCAQPEYEKIKYDGDRITWGAVNGATKYELTVNGVAQPNLISGTEFVYNANQTDFTVTIKPIGSHSNSFDGDVSLEKKFMFLEMVTGLKIQNGELSWNGDENKTYLLDIDGQQVEVEGSKYSGDKLRTGSTMSVKIKEISKDPAATYFSHFTPVMNAYILPAPTLKWSTNVGLDGDQNAFSWSPIASAKGYTVTVTRPSGNNDVYEYGSSVESFSYNKNFEEVGEYKITIKANAEESMGTVSSSKESSVFTVVRPAAPQKVGDEEFIVSNASILAEGFTVTVKEVTGVKYRLFKNGTQDGADSSAPQFVRKSLINNDVIKAQEDSYEIQIIGKVNSSDRVTLNSKDKLGFTIKILAVPANVRMEGFYLKYNAVNNAENNYWITGAAGGSGMEGTSDGVNLDAYLTAGNYNIQVCAKGNGHDVLASNYSAPVAVYRIPAPTNLKIDTSIAGNGTLTYDASNFDSIEMYIGSAEQQDIVQNPDAAMNNMNDYIKESATYVSLVAVANVKREDGVYYMTSLRSRAKEFIKLSAPSQLQFTDTLLRWNQDGINDTQKGKINYRVYDAVSTRQFTDTLNAREFDISTLQGDKSYQFYVRAIGDGDTFINSKDSVTAVVYKLEKLTVTRANGVYKWDAVSQATSYSVTINGNVAFTENHEMGKTYECSPLEHFTSEGTYTVSVMAKGNSIDTISSEPFTFEQDVVQLAQPNTNDITVTYDKPNFSTDGNIKVTVANKPEGVSGYRYYIGGNSNEVKTGDVTTCLYNAKNTGEYDIYVEAIGGMFRADNVYTIDSLKSSKKVVTLLAAPNKDSIDLYDGTISWATTNAIKYQLKITIKTQDESKSATYATEVFENSYKLYKDVKDGKFTNFTDFWTEVYHVTIEITSIGNGTTKISSQTVTQNWPK